MKKRQLGGAGPWVGAIAAYYAIKGAAPNGDKSTNASVRQQ
jgi:hypothetical protein